MKYYKQLNRHNPDNGVYGDCYRTAIACLLDLEPYEVPHVYEDNSEEMAKERMDKWLLENHRLVLFTVAYCGDLKEILETIHTNNSNCYYLLTGESSTGCNHNVICKGGKIIHDPSQNNAGIIGPCDDGYYWVEVLVRYTVEE